MILDCPRCRTRFRIDAARLGAGNVNVRCSRCGQVFRAGDASEAATPPPALGQPPRPGPARDSQDPPWSGLGDDLVAPPSTSETDDTLGATETRRVDAASILALALETASPEVTRSDDELDTHDHLEPEPRSQDFEAPESSAPPDFEELFASSDPSNLFDELEALPGDYDPSSASVVDSVEPERFVAPPVPAHGLPEGFLEASIDLPETEPASGRFLDVGEIGPSTDLEMAEALESDFLGRSPSAAPPVGAPFHHGFDDEGGYDDPPPLGELGPDDGLIDPHGGPGPSLGRLELDVPPSSTSAERTRVVGGRGAPRVAYAAVRQARSRWPTLLGLVLGGLVAATFVPGLAPPPFDRVAPVIAEVLHPASRPRLPHALPQVRSEAASVFPYTVGRRTVVVVRGEAVHAGEAPLQGVRAYVLMLDGEREVARSSALLGDIPSPPELERRLIAGVLDPGRSEADDRRSAGKRNRGRRQAKNGAAPPRPPPDTLQPGERAPFMVVFPTPPLDADRLRFRVEFASALGSSGAADPPSPTVEPADDG